MKRLLMLLMLLLAVLPALADQAEEIVQVIHPGYVVSQRLDANGATLMVLTRDGSHILLVMEGNVITVDNPSALLPGDVLPSWSFSGDAVAWSYPYGGEVIRYRAAREHGEWGPVDVTVTGGEVSRIVYMDGGALRQYALADGQRSEWTPMPAPWLQDCIVLPQFAADALPLNLAGLPMAAYQPAADLLADGMEAICGVTCPDGLLMLCDRPNHVSRVLVACRWNEEARGYQVTRSAPITADCTGVPLASGMALVIGGCTYDVGLEPGGGWGVTAMHLQDADAALNSEHLVTAGQTLQHALWGANPWSDLARIDWQSLPRTCSEAAGAVNPADWGMVSNPNEQDTLHLRQQPDARAYSLGRYFNGTPLRVLSSNKDWVQVSIGGVTGWMKKDYVALNYAMQHTACSLRTKRISASYGASVSLYADQHASDLIASLQPGDPVLILGFSGDQWYHVLSPDRWQYGYIPMDAVK